MKIGVRKDRVQLIVRADYNDSPVPTSSSFVKSMIYPPAQLRGWALLGLLLLVLAILIVAVVVRTSHAYTGRPLRPGGAIVAVFVVLAAAAVSRVAAIPGHAGRETMLWLATTLWTLAFAVALRVQGAVLLRPRIDARSA